MTPRHQSCSSTAGVTLNFYFLFFLAMPSPCSLRQLPPSKAVSSDTCACSQGCHAPANVQVLALPGSRSCQACAPAGPAWEACVAAACWRSGCTPCRDMLNQGWGLSSLPCSAGSGPSCCSAQAAGSTARRMAACPIRDAEQMCSGASGHLAAAPVSPHLCRCTRGPCQLAGDQPDSSSL